MSSLVCIIYDYFNTPYTYSYVRYDVEAYQRLEALIEQKLPQYPCEEETVLVLLERVGEAQRLAVRELKELQQEEGGDGRRGGKKRKGGHNSDSQGEGGSDRASDGGGGSSNGDRQGQGNKKMKNKRHR